MLHFRRRSGRMGEDETMSKLVASLKQYRLDPASDAWEHIFPKKPKRKGQCKVIYCARLARVQVRRTLSGLRTTTHAICPTCESRLFRANNPAKEAYRQIKDRALRRGQIFQLTFDEFLSEIEGTEYLARRGTGINELHLDREKVHLGYVRGNIKVITCAENLRKRNTVDYCRGPF